MKNLHAGKMAFVTGSGPSIRTVDPSCLSEYVTIACNQSILKFRDADYFMFVDSAVSKMEILWTQVENMRCTVMANDYFDGPGWDNLKEKLGDRFVLFKKRWGAKGDEAFILSDDFPLCLGDTVMHQAVNFAHVLGCSPIVLLGADCTDLNGDWHFNDNGDEYKDEKYDAYLKAEIERIESTQTFERYNDLSYRSCIGHWGKIADLNPSVRIINASGGILDAFPRMSLPEVIEEFGQ